MASLDKYLEVEVKDIKDLAGDKIEAYKAPLYFADKKAPTATASFNAPTLEVKFSEPLSVNTAGNQLATSSTSNATVSVDGVATTNYNVVLDKSTAVLKGATSIKVNNLPAGKHTISIVGATDLAGNFLPAFTTEVTVAADTVAPEVTSFTSEGNKVRVKFSEPVVDVANLVAPSTTAAVAVTDGTTTIHATAAQAVDKEGTEFLIDATSLITSGNFVSKELTVIAGSKDASGNVSKELKKTLLITKDTAAPKVVETKIVDKNIIVKFDESVVAGTTPIATNINVAFTSADGVVYAAGNKSIGSVSYKYDVNNDGDTTDAGEDHYLVIPVTDSSIINGTTLKAGSYKVTLTKQAVKDASDNENDATTLSFNVGSTSTTDAIVTATPTEVTPGVLQFAFNKVLTADQLKAENFTIDGVAVPADAKIYFFGNKQTVRIELPANYISVTGNRTLAVKDIKDEDGNTLSKATGATSAVVQLKENILPTATKLTLVDAQHLTVDFSEALATLPGTVSGTKVKVNGVEIALDTTAPFALDTTKKVLTIKADSATAFKLTDVITVEINGTNVTDVAGNTVKDGTLSK